MIKILIKRLFFLIHFVFIKRNKLAQEDYAAWILQHPQLRQMKTYDGFISLLIRFPEYRHLFYYRCPFVARHIFNFFLRRREPLFLHSKMGGAW